MIYIIVYLLIAFFISSTLLYSSLIERNKASTTDDTTELSAVFAYAIPALWPLSILLVIWATIDERLKERTRAKCDAIARRISYETKRLSELSTKELQYMYNFTKDNKSISKMTDSKFYGALEKELLDRAVETHVLEHKDGEA